MVRRGARALGALLLLAGAAASQSAADAPAGAPVAWNVLVYAAIDNDAEEDGNFFGFLDGVRAALTDDPQLQVLLFADRSAKYSDNATSLGEDFTGARLYRVGHAACERLDGGAELPELALGAEHEPDSADPQWVRKFLAWAAARHPARHTALLLYGHADGRAMCSDEDSGHEMGFAQLTELVPAERAVDLMALELCFMGGVEVGYQWRPGNGGFSTRYLVAIPNAGPPLDWERVFARLGGEGAGGIAPAELTPERLGTLIVEEGGLGREALAQRVPELAEHVAHEAVGCYDLTRAADLKRAVDGLAAELARGDARAAFESRVRGPGPDGLVLNYAHGALFRDPFVDLHDLAARAAACDALPEAAQEAAAGVVRAVNEFVLASWGGSALPRFAAGASGVYVTCPVETAGGWSRCRWYSPAAVPGVWGRLAWCRDGATPGDGVVQNWFELFDSWLDEPGGGVNAYAF